MHYAYRLTLCLLLLAALPRAARAQRYEWGQQLHNLSGVALQNQVSATDGVGNTYVGATFRDSARVGATVYRATGGTCLLVKYTPRGTVDWVRQLGGWVPYRIEGVPTAAGGFFLLGRTAAGTNWNGVPATITGEFYARCSAAGALQWMQALPFQQATYPNHVTTQLAVDGAGDPYLLSSVLMRGGFGSTAIDSSGLFLAQASGSTGAVQWVRRLAATGGPCRATGGLCLLRLHSQPLGSGCLLTGAVPGGGTVQLGAWGSPGATVVAPVAREAFVLRVTASGAAGAALLLPNDTGNDYLAAATDGTGNLYVGGGGSVPITFGPGQVAPAGMYLARFDPAGTLQWLRYPQGGAADTRVRQLLPTPLGVVAVHVVNAAGSYRFGAVRVPSPGTSFVLQYTAQGEARWAACGSHNTRVSQDEVRADAEGNLYWSGEPAFSAHLTPLPVVAYGPLTFLGAGRHTFRITQRTNQVQGVVYLDANANGRRDAGESAFPQPTVLEMAAAGPPTYASAQPDGAYAAFADTGVYRLSLPAPPVHYTVTEPAGGYQVGTFHTFAQQDSARHFGLAPVSNQQDVRLTLTAVSERRRGVPITYQVRLDNVGTVPVAQGTVKLLLDPQATYIGSVPAATQSGDTLVWTYANLAPFDARTFNLRLSVALSTPLGTPLTTRAQADPLLADAAPLDNVATDSGPVLASATPNDIAVDRSEVSPAQLAARVALDYTVRFQNVGADTAYSMVIADTLPAGLLQAGTFRLTSQSHNCSALVTGTGVLIVRLLNVRLPPLQQNPLQSQGFIRFVAQPVTTLPVGTLIPNGAALTFNAALPVRTNTATTLVAWPAGLPADRAAAALTLAPNPATEVAFLTGEVATGGPATLRLLDARGRVVAERALQLRGGPLRQEVAVRALPAGLYVVQLVLPDGRRTSQRLVVAP